MDYSGLNAAYPDQNIQLRDSRGGTPRSLGMGHPTDEVDSTLFFTTSTSSTPTPARKKLSAGTLCKAALDFCTALPAVYFFVFGVFAMLHDGAPADVAPGPMLFRMAQINPTLFPIFFALATGVFIQSYVAWNLEQGISLGAVEYMLTSRTVGSAILTPAVLRYFHPVVIPLLLLWTLSPLGGQASLRVVYPEPSVESTPAEVYYLNTLTPSKFANPLGPQAFLSAVNAAFLSALASSNASKEASQDQFGNIKIPLLESSVGTPDAEGWWRLDNGTSQNVAFSSLVGIPVRLPSPDRAGPSPQNLSFTLQSLYMYPRCTMELWDLSVASNHDKWSGFLGAAYQAGVAEMAMAVQVDSIAHNITATTYPRKLRIGFPETQDRSVPSPLGPFFNVKSPDPFATMAECDLTSTYVEVAVACQSSACNATKVRPSFSPHLSLNLTSLDHLRTEGPADPYANDKKRLNDRFFGSRFNSTGQNDIYHSSALRYFFLGPDSPFSGAISEWKPTIFSVGETMFSHRLAQLLNTYWFVTIAPYGVTGRFNMTSEPDGWGSGMGYNVSRADASESTVQIVIRGNLPWFVVLVIGSAWMCSGGTGAVWYGIQRRGPAIIDSFASMIRDSRHAKYAHLSSAEDGTNIARRLKDIRLFLGDVRPREPEGRIALWAGHVTRRRSAEEISS